MEEEVGTDQSGEVELPWELADEPQAAKGVHGAEAAQGAGLKAAQGLGLRVRAAEEAEAAAAQQQGVGAEEEEELDGICCEPGPSNLQVRVPVVRRTLGLVRVRPADPDHSVSLL